MKKSMSALAFTLIVVGVLFVAMFSGIRGVASAYDVNATGDAQISVTVNNKTIVDITPQAMDWGNVDPGSVVTQYTEPTNGITLSQIQIENLGSTDITYVWANVSQPTSNPFGTGNVANYDPGNWLVMKRTSDTNYWFIDRVEFNSSTDYIYLVKPSNWVSFGKIRDANKEYFWVLNGTATTDPQVYCNGSSGSTVSLVVGQDPHNTTQTGTINLVNGNIAYTSITASGDPNWGIVNGISVGGATYCVAVSADCTKLRLFRWNADAPAAGACSAFGTDGLTLNGGTPIYPGGSLIADVQLHVPYGVPDGSVPTGTLTVVASAQ